MQNKNDDGNQRQQWC